MTMPKYLKYKHLFFLALSIVFFLFAVIFSNSLLKISGPEKTSRQFLSAFQKQKIRSGFLINQIDSSLKINSSPQSEFLKLLFKNATKENISIFVYTDKKLILWSDNHCPLPIETNPEIFNKSIIRLPDAWYGINSKISHNRQILALFKIKSEYSVENEFLKNEFVPPFNIHHYNISAKSGSVKVNINTGKILCYLNPVQPQNPETTDTFIILFVFLTAFCFFLLFVFYSCRNFAWFRYYPLFFFFAILSGVFIARYFSFHFKIPSILYQSSLFSPLHYATSNYLPSLGDLFINSFLLFVVPLVFFDFLESSTKRIPSSSKVSYIFAILSIIFIFIFFIFIMNLMTGLVKNSTIPLELDEFFSFNLLTLLAYFIIALLTFAFVLPALLLMRWYHHLIYGKWKSIMLLFILLLIFIPFLILLLNVDPLPYIFLGIFLLFTNFYHSGGKNYYNTIYFIISLLLLISISTYNVSKYKSQTELNQRRLLAHKLISDRDPLTEYLIDDAFHKINSDPFVIKLLREYRKDVSIEDSLVSYLRSEYFTKYWDKYNIAITLCEENKMLNVVIPYNQVIGCDSYFNEIINTVGQPTSSPNIFFLDYGSESTSYLSVLSIYNRDKKDTLLATIYLDMTSRAIPRGLGYPELLVDKNAVISTKLATYSYAIYKNSKLIRNVGKYNYSLNLSYYDHRFPGKQFFESYNYNHLLLRGSNDNVIIISRYKNDVTETLSIFSCLSIIFFLLLIILIAFRKIPLSKNINNFDFRMRIQLAMISLLAISFLSAGAASWYFFRRQDTTGNKDKLKEKTHSILIELQQKLSTYHYISPEMSNDLYYQLNRLSLVFFSDINLYDTKGNMIASSRPQIFENGLLSTRINTEAFHYLLKENRTQYVQYEKVGSYEFLSAYMPLRNQNDQIIAYVNLPYFARQAEIKQEFSNFLITYINIYVILIVISVLAALLITSYITSPLRIISEKIKKISLGKPNEKIIWNSTDEIGRLIIEYNKMIDQLVLSAEQLGRSERESAWREMAKQVAHEIKNPLTPMKLSVQHMLQAWNENTPDFDSRIKHISQTLISQIEALADIASAFSDFAKMPVIKAEKTTVKSFIIPVLKLYENQSGIKIITEFESPEPVVFADKNQMQRVMMNLLKNSVQAIDPEKLGTIIIKVEKEATFIRISVNDNGIGIREEQKHQIFTPNFTTKSGGMGLGLAMVKNIILDHGGTISFESNEKQGTTFIIHLPAYEQNRVENTG